MQREKQALSNENNLQSIADTLKISHRKIIELYDLWTAYAEKTGPGASFTEWLRFNINDLTSLKIPK